MWRIKDWGKHFEKNRTRELRSMLWVPVPTKMDGDGYTELLDHPNGAAHYGAWIACVHVAAKSQVRGTLMRDRCEAHNFESLARITRVPKVVLEEAIPRLISIGWLETLPDEQQVVTTTLHGGADKLRQDCGAGAALYSLSPVVSSVMEKGSGGKPKIGLLASKKVQDAFREWFAYLTTRGKDAFDPELAAAKAVQFFDNETELVKSIDYAILNQYVTLTNYSHQFDRIKKQDGFGRHDDHFDVHKDGLTDYTDYGPDGPP